jgi:hypothetical protein
MVRKTAMLLSRYNPVVFAEFIAVLALGLEIS